MCRSNPELVTEFKERRSKYSDKWKKFLKRLIYDTEYFKTLPFMCQEELLYSLKPEFYEEGQVLFDNGDMIQALYYISEGEISVVLQLDNGEEVITDILTQGSNIGAYSILSDNKQIFTFRANTPIVVQVLDRELLSIIREQFKDLDKVLQSYETYIKEESIPVCDYKCHPVSSAGESNVKEKFRLAVNRSMVLNEYENKKNSRIGLLIEQVYYLTYLTISL